MADVFKDYPPQLVALLGDVEIYELGPGVPDQAVRDELDKLDLDNLFAPHRIANPEMASACHSGLWLRHNFLDESHTISQNLHNPTGSFWHGIMHRREPDFSNAKYWFRQVGAHEIFPDLAAAAHQIDATLFTGGEWDPFRFVDLCEQASNNANVDPTSLLRVAVREWELLFDYCYRRAIGKA